MLQARLDGQYGDVMERALYNNILSGISLEGRCFFYDNPMASSGSRQRVAWPWWTPCCPPNLARLVSSLSGYLYSQREDAIAVHHYVTSEARTNGITLRVRSGLPIKETTRSKSGGSAGGKTFRSAFQVGRALRRQGQWESLAPPVESGYVTVRRTWVPGDRVELNFGLPVRMKFCRYEVDVNRGRLALARGPLVYCLEQVDNGPDLDAVALASDGSFEPAETPGLPDGALALIGPGVRERAQADSLYADEPPAKQEIKVTAVPYYAWNNRGPGEMLVWVRRAS
jgi:DUF1680 family protein